MYGEGSKMANDEEYDEFLLSTASIGVALTAVTVATVGATTPLKVGASIVKVAHKTKKISKSFQKVLSSKIAKTADFSALKKIDGVQ